MLVFANIFQPLIDVFESILLFFHNQVGLGWGLSIVALTVAARIVLIPLTLKQFRSMQSMQRLSPQIKALQAKYKGDKQRLNQEMMRFYQENKVNPLASCLPLVLQIPIFISLYYMLRNDLRHNICPALNQLHAAHTVPCGSGHAAGFLFIPDITNKASGLVLVALIVLYVGSQVGSTLLMSMPTADKNQRRIMLFLPIIFVSFIIRFPAGLIVYWVTTNLWTVAQQFIVRRSVGSLQPAPAAAGAGGGGLMGLLSRGGGLKSNGDDPGDSAAVKHGGESNGKAPDGKSSGAVDEKAARGKGKGAREVERVGARGGRSAAARGGPPPSARKKKKRSGRRR